MATMAHRDELKSTPPLREETIVHFLPKKDRPLKSTPPLREET